MLAKATEAADLVLGDERRLDEGVHCATSQVAVVGRDEALDPLAGLIPWHDVEEHHDASHELVEHRGVRWFLAVGRWCFDVRTQPLGDVHVLLSLRRLLTAQHARPPIDHVLPPYPVRSEAGYTLGRFAAPSNAGSLDGISTHTQIEDLDAALRREEIKRIASSAELIAASAETSSVRLEPEGQGVGHVGYERDHASHDPEQLGRDDLEPCQSH